MSGSSHSDGSEERASRAPDAPFNPLLRLIARQLHADSVFVLGRTDEGARCHALGAWSPQKAGSLNALYDLFAERTQGFTQAWMAPDLSAALEAGNAARPFSGVSALAAVPLREMPSGRPGVLCVLSAAPRQWTNRDYAELLDAAGPAAHEWTREQELQRRQEEIRHLELLRQLNEALQGAPDLSSIYERIYQLLPRLLQVQRASILLYDPGLDALISDQLIGVRREIPMEPSAPQPVGHSVSGRCFAERRTIRVDDCEQTDLIPLEHVDRLSLRSTLAAPIQTRDRVLGVLRVDNTERTHAFSPRDEELVGAVGQLLGYVIENAQLRAAQEEAANALRTAEARYRLLVEQLPAVTYVTPLDGSGVCSYVSPQTEALLGYSAEEWRTEPFLWRRIIHPDDRERVVAAYREGLAAGEEFQSEYRVLTKDERVVWVADRARLVRGPEGEPACIQGVCVDTTATRQAEQDLRHLAATADCILWHADIRDTGCLCWSLQIFDEQAAQRLMPVDQEPGESWAAAWRRSLLPEDQERIDTYSAHQIRNGLSYTQEFRCRRADGEVRWLAEHVHVETVEPGRWRAVGVCLDQTEQKRAEEALQRERNLLRTLVDSIPAIIFAKDVLGRYLFANVQLARLYGVEDPEEIVGKRLTDFCSASDAQVRQVLRDEVDLFRSGQPQVGALRCAPGVEGDPAWYRVTRVPLRDGEGRVTGFVCISFDTTEKQRAEEALRDSEARYRELVDQSSDMIFTHDTDGVLLSVNQAGAEMLGYAPEELVGKSIGAFVAPEHHEILRERARQRLEEGVQGLTTSQLALLARDGRRVTVEVKSRAIVRQEKIVCIHGTARDITERLLLEEQLRQAQRMEAVGRLAGGIAHDFNNMLAVITGYSELLLAREMEADATRTCVREIRKAGDRAAALTRQLLAFSRRQILSPQLLDLNELVGNMHLMLRRMIGPDVELVTLLEPELRRVKADPGQLEQVLMNLVVNARDAMPQGGRLTLKTENVHRKAPRSGAADEPPAGDYVCLTVADTGAGIPADVLPRIFEPFFTTKEMGKGTGLGLATVYGVIKQSNGWIQVESAPGEGSTFGILLPCAPEERKRRKGKDAPAQMPGGSETILLAEDEDQVRSLVRNVLNLAGYRVLEALTGDEALRLSEETPGEIQLLLTDVMMPGMNGRELAERAARQRPRMRILFMSGYTEEALEVEGSETVPAFIQKPFTSVALAAKVREVLDSGRAESGAREPESGDGEETGEESAERGAGRV